MRSIGTLLPLALGLALFAAAPAARALSLCDEQSRLHEEERAEEPLEEIEELPTELIDAILPCAMLESGAVGPWCLDADVYVVTPTGVLLCHAGLAAFDVPSTSAELTGHTAPVATSSPAGLDASALAQPLAVAVPAPLLLDVADALEGAPRPDRPHRPDPPWVPG